MSSSRKKARTGSRTLKENAGRSQLSTAQAKAIEAAGSVEALAAALDSIVDERASPRHGIAPAGTPILQPTGERRRTGSHYTPRSLTAPIVKYALEPAFERLGDNATPDQILDLKLCDPAMGSGAFLVEACRAIGERLVKAWERWPETRPVIPADEDEELHARRLVAQRCLYGVDKNPRAVDLARLSLWLATLARDHEFTFLDHALKCGDSLVGLTTAQIAATHWDTTMPPTFVGKLVSDHLRDAEQGRARIREQAEWATEAELRPQLKAVDAKLAVARLIGNGIVAAFFSADKPKKRIERLVEFQKTVQNHLGSSRWVDAVTPFAASLATGEHPIPPFHWQIEFPEVFARENGGFDAIVGNPPFAGKNTIIKGNVKNYLPWLQTLHEGAHGNADLVAHFFRRAFGLLRHGGVFGLIATNTIGQGDTRATGLAPILSNGGAITRATRRLKWPGEAAVVVSVVHIAKGAAPAPVLNGRSARRISAYLVEGNLDKSPGTLAANDGKAFIGSFILGMGFTFDDVAAAKGSASTLDEMHKLIRRDARNKKRIFPYIGGEEVNNDPKHAVTRYIIDFRTMSEHEARGWPDLMEIIESKVKPDRLKQGSIINPNRWWMHARSAADMYRAIAPLKRVLVRCLTSTQFQTFTFLDKGFVYDQSLIVFAFENYAPLSILCSRVHEAWALFLGATFKDDGRYNLVPGIIIR